MTALRSMTGYGAHRFELRGVPHTVELRSVNNRYLKLSFKFPSSLNGLQDALRNEVSSLLSRGAVDVSLRCGDTASEMYAINTAQLQRYAEQLAEQTGSNSIPVELLLSLPGVATRNELVADDEVAEVIRTGLRSALAAFNSSREAEASQLAKGMEERLVVLRALLGEVAALTAEQPKDYAAKLAERIGELTAGQGITLDPQVLAREVALFADRTDVTEEIERFERHLDSFREVLTKGGPVGKELDFIVQELNREANTIGSKCSSYEITRRVISMKSDIERIREQVQNIE